MFRCFCCTGFRSWAIARVRTPPFIVNGLLVRPLLFFLISFSFVSVILGLIQRNIPIDAFSLQMTTNFVRFVSKYCQLDIYRKKITYGNINVISILRDPLNIFLLFSKLILERTLRSENGEGREMSVWSAVRVVGSFKSLSKHTCLISLISLHLSSVSAETENDRFVYAVIILNIEGNSTGTLKSILKRREKMT